MSRHARAYVYSVCGSHLRVLDSFVGILRCCMLPRTTFSTHLVMVEDGREAPITMSYAAALEMFTESHAAVVRTRRLRTRSSEHAAAPALLVAYDIGRLTANGSMLPDTDRIIVFTDDAALGAELGARGVLVVSPRACEEHDAWWARREQEAVACAGDEAATDKIVEELIDDAAASAEP